MEEPDYEVRGAEVIYTDRKPAPYNPLHRRKPNYGKMLLALGIGLAAGAVMLVMLTCFLGMPVWLSLLLWAVICFCAIGKKAAIWLIRFYQYKAPDRVRLRCVFYPSCSEYMILAIQKYGTVRGILKGIGRLNRCHAPNGGEDFP